MKEPFGTKGGEGSVPTLQKVVANRIEGTTYHKYQVVLPRDKIDELGWEQGEELRAELKDGQLVLSRSPHDQPS